MIYSAIQDNLNVNLLENFKKTKSTILFGTGNLGKNLISVLGENNEIIILSRSNNQTLSKNTSPKSLMAFGAMGAHINMALQALKARETD